MRFQNILLSFLIASTLLLFSSCNEDEDEDEDQYGKVEIHFVLTYDGVPLVTLEEYVYAEDFNIFITKFSLFLSNLQLISSGHSEGLVEVVFLNLTENQMDPISASLGTQIVVDSVKTGAYDGLQLSIGVPASLNAMNPSAFSPGHPLANTGEYWEGWSSYIFHKTEGRMDLDGDGNFEDGIALHIGSDAAFRSTMVEKEVIVENNQTSVITFAIDMKNMYNIQGQPYDLEGTPQIHHLGQLPLALPLMDNLITEFQ